MQKLACYQESKVDLLHEMENVHLSIFHANVPLEEEG